MKLSYNFKRCLYIFILYVKRSVQEWQEKMSRHMNINARAFKKKIAYIKKSIHVSIYLSCFEKVFTW